MKPCPEIATYQLQNGFCRATWLAVYTVKKIGTIKRVPTGNTWFERLPMLFEGNSEDDVVARAKSWWHDEQTKIANREASFAKAREARRQKEIAA